MSRPRGAQTPLSEADPLYQSLEIRDEWLGNALSTLPADRPAAEAAISELYRHVGAEPPPGLLGGVARAMLRLSPEPSFPGGHNCRGAGYSWEVPSAVMRRNPR